MDRAGRGAADRRWPTDRCSRGSTRRCDRAIIDFDLALLPELPVGNRDYNRRMESRMKAQAQNDANAAKRDLLELQSWTTLYTKLKTCTGKTAPVLSRSAVLATLCDLSLSGVPGGFFDGVFVTFLN